MKSELTRLTAKKLAEKADSVSEKRAFVGLDAFVDEIVRLVDKRKSLTEYSPIETISDLGQRLIAAAGRSTNIEMVVEMVKLGGNGPIMAGALSAFGLQTTCVGPLGEGRTHPAFDELAARARLISLGDPGHTDALEFEDGKIMLGKQETLKAVTWERLCERAGDELKPMLTESPLVALVNWTMLPAMSDIWENILNLLAEAGKTENVYFFDLADPEKHSDETVAAACHQIGKFSAYRRTVLGLNEKEAFRVGVALGYDGGQNGRSDVQAVAKFISQALPIDAVVVHPRAFAVVASKGELTADVDGPFTENPKISTGAGDHFNGGFCMGKMLGLSDEEAATAAVGTSGYYVRNAASPTLPQLAEFLEAQGAA